MARSRDRPILVRGTRGETHWTLWEEAEHRGGSGQQGYAACRQDGGAAPQQPQKQGKPWESAGRGGRGLVTMMTSQCLCFFVFFLSEGYLLFHSSSQLYFSLVSVMRPWLTRSLIKSISNCICT